ncbi:hypothetical protein JRQ81_017494 [Phrynocephalus forsythii]|uniref:Uncharacterized protein n=1 Tax=Phrynocephalus forsythii TaxID=171643 RepID=A0A9Q0XTQ1_9SAUR|nr:hypothetical protein JRQ81_017494 [Phrynocephalus forsythii]
MESQVAPWEGWAPFLLEPAVRLLGGGAGVSSGAPPQWRPLPPSLGTRGGAGQRPLVARQGQWTRGVAEPAGLFPPGRERNSWGRRAAEKGEGPRSRRAAGGAGGGDPPGVPKKRRRRRRRRRRRKKERKGDVSPAAQPPRPAWAPPTPPTPDLVLALAGLRERHPPLPRGGGGGGGEEDGRFR